MSPLDTLLAGLHNHQAELQTAPLDAACFTGLVYTRLADSKTFAETIHRLTRHDVQVSCDAQVVS
jgi:hypothetical protein